MSLLEQFDLLLRITRSRAIARRYFVVNGFDGALTMLGIIMGFQVTDQSPLAVVVSACLGAAVALGMSGVSSAYISEAAERRRELQALEVAMLTDLSESAHAQAARFIPVIIALVNGLAPLIIAVIIISPLWFSQMVAGDTFEPLGMAIIVALVVIFMLGVFLGKVSGTFWLWSGLRTLLIALVTMGVIFLFGA